jgi:hypothetical protein
MMLANAKVKVPLGSVCGQRWQVFDPFPRRSAQHSPAHLVSKRDHVKMSVIDAGSALLGSAVAVLEDEVFAECWRQ